MLFLVLGRSVKRSIRGLLAHVDLSLLTLLEGAVSQAVANRGLLAHVCLRILTFVLGTVSQAVIICDAVSNVIKMDSDAPL